MTDDFFALKLKPSSANSFGWLSFQLGLFFLASSALLGGLFLCISIFFGSYKRSQSYLQDYWNWPFLIAALFMLIGSFNAYSGWLAWVGLANWLPFFWAFWAFQPYLITQFARKRASICLLSGTIPVLITGFGQIWFGWEGPWQLFNGLIIWFVSSGGEPIGRLSGLFDYANIAGAWLAVVLPFSLASLLDRSLNLFKRSLIFLITSGIVIALILTDSRNAWGGLVMSIPLVIGPAHWLWLLPLLTFSLIPVFLSVFPGVPLGLQQFSREIVPEGLWSRLNDMRYARNIASTRVNQWEVAISIIKEQPWLGWGAAAFSVLYPLRTGQWHGHAHNLPLEMGVSHGFPAALFVTSSVLGLLIISLKRGAFSDKENNNQSFSFVIFDRAWWSSTFILVVMHAVDIPFFDSRLNIAGWVLLSGLRCLISSAKNE